MGVGGNCTEVPYGMSRRVHAYLGVMRGIISAASSQAIDLFMLNPPSLVAAEPAELPQICAEILESSDHGRDD